MEPPPTSLAEASSAIAGDGPEVVPEAPGWPWLGFALSLSGLITWKIPFLGLATTIPGIILCAKALQHRQKRLALAGVFVGAIGFVFSVTGVRL